MIECIINTIFSIPYLLIGVLFAVLLDLVIYRTKSSSRLSFMEIWGCCMCWPLVLVTITLAFFLSNDN